MPETESQPPHGTTVTRRATLVDHHLLEERRQQKQLVDALGEFLSRFHWQLYSTPTFRFATTFPVAKRAVSEWVTGFGPQAYAYAAFEEGYAGGRTHCHVLLGGLASDLAKSKAGRLWKRGLIKIEQYDPKRGACWYAAKFPNDGEFIGNLQRVHKRRRKRGRRRRRIHE